MLNESNLLDVYWKELVHTVVYTLNRAQLRVHNKRKPYELWYGKKPSVKYFKVFGSKCFIKKYDDGLGIFDARCDNGIFLGYSTHSKAYKCFKKCLKRIVECVHVIIDEDLQQPRKKS